MISLLASYSKFVKELVASAYNLYQHQKRVFNFTCRCLQPSRPRLGPTHDYRIDVPDSHLSSKTMPANFVAERAGFTPNTVAYLAWIQCGGVFAPSYPVLGAPNGDDGLHLPPLSRFVARFGSTAATRRT
jgi:hypothetical protein